MTAARLFDLARMLVKRAAAADFQRERASDEERDELAAAATPVTDSLAQDYVAWRRAALWIAAVLLSLGALLAIAEHSSTAAQVVDAAVQAQGQAISDAEYDRQLRQVETSFGEGNLSILDGLQGFLLFVKVAVAALAVAAALRWTRVASSRTLARWAWLVALVLPLIVSGWPWGQSLDFSHIDHNGFAAGRGQLVKQQVSVALGAALMGTIAPKLVALFPGIMRSSLTLKTLLPQAAAPGWLTVVFAPFLIGFLLLILSFLSQVQGSWVLILAVILLAAGPCIYVRRAKDLVRPHSSEEVGSVVRGIRGQALLFNAAGALLLFFYLCGLDGISWATALHLGLDAGGGVMLTMVAISDLTLALLAFSHRQGADFHASELREPYERRLQALASAGLTDIDATMGLPLEAAATAQG